MWMYCNTVGWVSYYDTDPLYVWLKMIIGMVLVTIVNCVILI